MTSTSLNSIDRHKINSLNLFEYGSSSFFSNLEAQAQILPLGKGQVLFLHEDQAERFFVIKKGRIKLFRETLDGAQAVVDVLTVDHIFGETAIFQEDLYPYSAEATEPTEVISLPLSILKAEIEKNQKLALTMLSSMARYRKHQDQELEHRTIQSAPQRIGCFLLGLTNQESNGEAVINLPYDKTLVASRLGMQPETFSRALRRLKKETGIEIKGASIKVDNLNQLSEYSCSACSSEFPCKDLKASRAS